MKQAHLFIAKILLSFTLLGCIQSAYSQKYFEFTEEADTSAKNFYNTSPHFTLCYIASTPDNYYGASMLIHYKKERFSSYFEFSTNIEGTYTVTGTNQSGNYTRQKGVHYTNWIAATGLASAIDANWLVYIAFGIRNQETKIENKTENDIYYQPTKDDYSLHVGIGAFYILPHKITLQGGYDLTSDAIKLGIGYTF